MPVTMSAEALKNKREYDKRYARENFIGKNIAFNKNNQYDMEVLEWIRKQNNGNEYIKRLVYEDKQKTIADKQKATADV